MAEKVITILAADFNRRLVDAMIEAASEVLSQRPEFALRVVRVPGAYEVPLVADWELKKPAIVGLVVLGYIERGETLHGEVMGQVVQAKLVDLQIQSGKPMGIGIIGPGATAEQAEVRHLDYAAAAARALLHVLDLAKEV